jgi:Ca2+-binding RTX toxin-like protein
LWGGAGNDSLIGGLGNDVLRGEAGADTLSGGAGNDVYYVDGSDTITGEAATAGEIDTVHASVNWAFTDASNLENLILDAGGALTATGNVAANRLEGNANGNTLTGNGGNDSLFGMDGNDSLLGGAGNDQYDGGLGDDLLTDSATATSSDAYFWGLGQGADTVSDSAGALVGTSGDSLTISGVQSNQVWLTKVAGTRDLKLSLIGATDSLVVKNWFSNTTATTYTSSIGALETLTLASGPVGEKTLASSNVAALVAAMAGNVPLSSAAITPTVLAKINQYWV